MVPGLHEPNPLVHCAGEKSTKHGTSVFQLRLPTVAELAAPGPSSSDIGAGQLLYQSTRAEVDGLQVERLPDGGISVGGVTVTLLTEASYISGRDPLFQNPAVVAFLAALQTGEGAPVEARLRSACQEAIR